MDDDGERDSRDRWMCPRPEMSSRRARRRWRGRARGGRGRESATNEREGESEGEGRRERSSWCSSRGRARRGRCERAVGRWTASDGIIIIVIVNVNVVRRLDDERER